ncbi:MAG: FAD:protein FMN transferase [Clostridia bacterium]|nr:FAD:protein FMN transferase [Clostridia bacterium]
MKTLTRKIAALAALLLSVLALASCEQQIVAKNRIFYEYFDTVSVVYDYTGGTQADFDATCALVEAELAECHRLYDIYEEYDGVTNLKTLNDRAGMGAVKVDERIIDLLTFSVEMYELTDGNVNVAMGSVLSIWHRERELGEKIPTPEELSAAAEHTDITKMVIDREAMTVELCDPEMSLDVGAVAKGYTAERIALMLKERGISGYVLDFGGNLRAVGEKPSGDGWVSGIRNPDPLAPDAYVRTVMVRDAALVTSGTYERFYTVGEVSYHHIISKDTLMPADKYVSVTIMSPSSALADALSTAVFNMTPDEARSLADSLGNIEITLVTADGEVTVIS